MQIPVQSLKYYPMLPSNSPKYIFNLYDHNQRADISKIEYIVDHHDYKELNCHRHLISHMGSALTLIYYLINPKKLEQVS